MTQVRNPYQQEIDAASNLQATLHLTTTDHEMAIEAYRMAQREAKLTADAYAAAEATQPLRVAELNSQLVVERAALNEAKAAALPVEPNIAREEDGDILWA